VLICRFRLVQLNRYFTAELLLYRFFAAGLPLLQIFFIVGGK